MNERDFHDRHYEADAARLQGSALFARVHDRAARRFLRDAGVGPRHRLLSLGCGDGALERRLALHVGEIVGLDLSPVAVRKAGEAASAAGLRNVSFVVSREAVPALAALGEFDCVAAFAFLHHLGDAEIGETLRRARRVLRPGGCFYSSDPSRRRLVRLFAGLVREAYRRHHSPEERELEPEALAAAARDAGFAPLLGYVDYFLGPLAWLAPGTPAALAAPLEALDSLALHVPLLRRYASSFSLLARVSA
jgi:SAM-dependent methyltransferase